MLALLLVEDQTVTRRLAGEPVGHDDKLTLGLLASLLLVPNEAAARGDAGAD